MESRPQRTSSNATTPQPHDVCITEAIERATAEMQSQGRFSVRTMHQYSVLWRTFCAYAVAVGITLVSGVDRDLAVTWIYSRKRDGGLSADGTMSVRRACLIALFAIWRSLGFIDFDPLLDVPTIDRPLTYVRPLETPEMHLCEARALTRPTLTRPPAVLAIAQASALTSEIIEVTEPDLDLETGTVHLRGTRNVVERTVPLTQWGVHALRRHLEHINAESGPILYRGTNITGPYTSVSETLRKILIRAGLWGEPGVKVRSIRQWAGLVVFEQTGRIEEVARVLGNRDLEVAAHQIDYPWRKGIS